MKTNRPKIRKSPPGRIPAIIMSAFVLSSSGCFGCTSGNSSSSYSSTPSLSSTPSYSSTPSPSSTPNHSTTPSYSSKNNNSSITYKINSYNKKTCIACHGTGIIRQYATNDPYDPGYLMECVACHGQGWYYE